MEGESAIQAVHGPAIEAAKARNEAVPKATSDSMSEMRADYEHQLDARYAGARGFIDAIVYPEDTRDVLALALRASLQNPGPHLGPFVLPAHFDDA
jgi:3-methylcrotonyl-CoA carboxylase beta subunit